MPSPFRELVKTLLRAVGWQIAPISAPDQVRDFIRLVRPVTTLTKLIRIGGQGDGSYLVPDDMADIAACFSPGVAGTSTFEADLASRGIRSFLADYSVDAPSISHPLIEFEKKFLGMENDAIYMTLETWIERAGPFESDLILQMDIEGAEYDVLFETSNEALLKFRILLIEFHQLDYMISHQLGLQTLRRTFVKLLKHFEIVHIHPNNIGHPHLVSGYEVPSTMEFTLLRKDCAVGPVPTESFPHPLDRPNVPGLVDYPLPRCWFNAT